MGRSGPDSGGYTKPIDSASANRGPGEHFGASGHGADEFGGDFTKVDFDKPLFEIKQKDSGADSGAYGGVGVRSLYSSSSAN